MFKETIRTHSIVLNNFKLWAYQKMRLNTKSQTNITTPPPPKKNIISHLKICVEKFLIQTSSLHRQFLYLLSLYSSIIKIKIYQVGHGFNLSQDFFRTFSGLSSNFLRTSRVWHLALDLFFFKFFFCQLSTSPMRSD